jgi:hypothetical protein
VKGSLLLVGRTYRVSAPVLDELGRRAEADAKFTVCKPPPRQGFTG